MTATNRKAVSICKPALAAEALKFASETPATAQAMDMLGNGKDEAQTGSKSLSGLVPSGDVRLTANIRGDLHLKLKIAAANRRTTIGELIEDLIHQHI